MSATGRYSLAGQRREVRAPACAEDQDDPKTGASARRCTGGSFSSLRQTP